MKKTLNSTIKETFMLYCPERGQWLKSLSNKDCYFSFGDNPTNGFKFSSEYQAEQFKKGYDFPRLQVKKMRIKQVTVIEEVNNDY